MNWLRRFLALLGSALVKGSHVRARVDDDSDDIIDHTTGKYK